MKSNARSALAALCVASTLASCSSGASKGGGGGGSGGGPASIAIVAGDGQSAPVATRLLQAATVVVRDAGGGAVGGVVVSFEIQDGGGSVDTPTATTDASGEASTGWILGPTPGQNHLRASAAGVETPVIFTATGTAAVRNPVYLGKVEGDTQTAAPGAAVETAPVVVVLDALGPVEGIDVTFAVTSGGGTVESTVAKTDASGQASCGAWTLGSTKGFNVLTASVPELAPVTFTAGAVNTSADVSLLMWSPAASGSIVRVADSVHVSVRLISTYQLATVTATVDGSVVALSEGSDSWWGSSISLDGKPSGVPIVVIVTAVDVLGHESDGVAAVVLDRFPTVAVSSPLDGAVARPTTKLEATCADDYPTGCTIIVAVDGEPIPLATSGEGSMSRQLDLSAYEGRAITLDISAVDSSSQWKTASRTVFVESSSRLSLRAELSGPAWDVSGTRILFLDVSGATPALKVLDTDSGTTQTVEAGPILSKTIWGCYGFLTPVGVIFAPHARPYPEPCNLYEWRAGITSTVAELDTCDSLMVAGNWATYSTGPSFWRRDLTAGVSTLLDTIERSYSGGPSNDVASNGDVVWAKSGNVYRWRGGSIQALTNDGANLWPITDGVNVAYVKHSSSLSPTGYGLIDTNRLAVHDGVTETILPQFTNNGGGTTPRAWYNVAGGYVAFVEESATYTQIWRYGPAGTEQLSFFSSPSTLDALGPDGTVLFTSNPAAVFDPDALGKRYRARPGAALEEIGSPMGHVLVRDGRFFVLLGNAVLEVAP